MRSLSYLLVALVVTVGLCKGAAIQEESGIATGEIQSADPPHGCAGTLSSLCGRKRRDVKTEIPVESQPPQPCTGSLCGRKRREAAQEIPVALAPPLNCTGLCGRKKREVIQQNPVELAPPLPSACHGSLCSRKKREVQRPVETQPPPSCTGSLCGRKRREAAQESPVELTPPMQPICISHIGSLCGRRKREVKQEISLESRPPGCTGTASLCGRKRREAAPESPLQKDGCKGPLGSLCG